MAVRRTEPPQIGKLGKLEKKVDDRTLRFARYLEPQALPALPTNVHWEKAVPTSAWPMLGNDRYGDCVCAAYGHALHTWTANAQASPTIVDEASVLHAYSAITGFNPSDPNTDQGTNMLDGLNYWRATGINGNKITAFTEVNPKNKNEVKAAIDLFGVCYIGVALPISAQRQTYWHLVSGSNNKPNSWGGHCVSVIGYTGRRVQFITWGQVMEMTWGFFKYYCDEAYTMLAQPEWFTASGNAPSGFNYSQLQSDLQQIGAA